MTQRNARTSRTAKFPPEASLKTLPGSALIVVAVADKQCRVCHYSYAPYPELWSKPDLCVFCRMDGKA